MKRSTLAIALSALAVVATPAFAAQTAAPSLFSSPKAQQAGLVAERPEGRNVFYRAEPEGLAPLVDWIGHYGAFWRERFATLRTLLKEIDP